MQSQPDTPHSGCLLRLALLPPTLSLFKRPCVEGRIVRTGQSLGLGHEVILTRLAVERCQPLPIRREEREERFGVERKKVGNNTPGGPVCMVYNVSFSRSVKRRERRKGERKGLTTLMPLRRLSPQRSGVDLRRTSPIEA